MTDNIHTVCLPDIGEGVVEGEVIEWLKNVGDALKQDEPVVVVMTDKATVELPSPYPGTLAKQYSAVGQTAIKGKPLYDIALATPIDPPPIKAVEITKTASGCPFLPPKDVPNQRLTRQPASNSHKALAAPPIRKLAKELGIDINAIQGKGSQGQVTREDMQAYVANHRALSSVEFPRFPDDSVEPLAGIPRLMAEKMALSKQHAAHFSYFEQIDATRLVQLRENIKKETIKEGIHLTYMPFLIRALSLSIQQYPKINSCVNMENHTYILHKQQNIGIAINTPLGLIVPVLRGVQALSLEEIIKEYDRLKTAALAHQLRPQDMKESTISISNFGVLGSGGMWATPVINYPEVAILAIARIQKRPLVKNGELLVRDTLNLSWSFDHRIIDGDMAANFSRHYGHILQHPIALL